MARQPRSMTARELALERALRELEGYDRIPAGRLSGALKCVRCGALRGEPHAPDCPFAALATPSPLAEAMEKVVRRVGFCQKILRGAVGRVNSLAAMDPGSEESTFARNSLTSIIGSEAHLAARDLAALRAAGWEEDNSG